MDTAIKIINMFFGTTAAQRFRRLIIYTITIAIIIILIQCIAYDKQHGISWRPAANININKD